jgi:fumarate reductase flavoprotein subunit
MIVFGDRQMDRSFDYDVMVIGGGGAGVMAAIHAADAGAKVCLLEANDKLGGSTALSGGAVLATGSKAMAAAGVEDTTANFLDYLISLNEESVDRAAVERVCEEGGKILDWLKDEGVEYFYIFDPYRCHGLAQFGEGLIQGLEGVLAKFPVDVALKSRVTRLIVEDGAVKGAIVDGEEIRAGAVVLATGGFGGDRDLVRQHLPRSASAGDWLFYIGNPANRGDGLKMGLAAGSTFVGEDQALITANNGVRGAVETMAPAWLLMVNKNGKRFINECSPYWVTPEALRLQPEQKAWGVFDARMFAEAKPDRRLELAYRAGFMTLTWLPEHFQAALADGRLIQADSLEALAARLGVDGPSLADTVARYNAACASGEDAEFGKPAEDLTPVLQAPFYAMEIRNHILWATQGGLPIDRRGQVLASAGGKPIPGLFAAGEVTGNVLGAKYPGTGFSNANSLVFGRIAGRQAADYAREQASRAAGQA